MGQALKKQIGHLLTNKEKKWFATALVALLALLSLIAFGFLSGFLKVTPAYAKGNTQIVTSDDSLQMVFTVASTNDAGRKKDPGMDQHIGRCTANIRDGVVNFSVYKGYPGYQCTLTISLANQGDHQASYQMLEIETPPGLLIRPVSNASGSIVKPGEKLNEAFVIMIQSAADENREYLVSIQMVFNEIPDE